MKLRRTVVLLTALAAAFTVTGGAMAEPADQGARRVLDLPGAAGTSRDAVEGSRFTGVTPARVLDTRSGLGQPSAGPVPAGGSVFVDLSEVVPLGTTAVLLNLTGIAPTSSTFVTVHPAEGPRPRVSNLNLAAGETRANAVTVALDASRSLALFNNAGSVNLVADISGYYSPAGEALYTSYPLQRILDTRNGAGPIRAGDYTTVDLGGWLPSVETKVITINLTVVNPTASTYLTVYAAGGSRPAASSINAAPGKVTSNQVTARIRADRTIQIYNHAGSAHVLVDLVGAYSTDSWGELFYPVSPTRIMDTRTDGGEPLRGGVQYPIVLTEDPAAPEAQMTTMVMNVTGAGGTASTYLTLHPSHHPLPGISIVNLAAGQTTSNLSLTALGWGADEIGPYYGFGIYNNSGTIHVVLDLSGYFMPAVA